MARNRRRDLSLQRFDVHNLGLALQAIEMACGIGLGLLAIAREGISFAMLGRMESEEDSSEDAVAEVREIVEELEEGSEGDAEGAREGAAVSR